MPPRQISFKALIYPHPKGQITLYLLLSQTWETFQQVTVLAAIPTMTGAAVSQGTHHAPHPATAASHATLQQVDACIITHAMTHPTSIVASHPAFATSPGDITSATIPWNGATIIPATPTALHRKQSQENQAKTFNPP